MPSSTSSSKAVGDGILALDRAPLYRLTAADRPGMAQPVPERPVPGRPWARIHLGAFLLFVAMVGAWEIHWRDYGAEPSYRNSNGAWAEQRRRIDDGEGDGLVLIGSSRTLFDIELPVWQAVTGTRPIQLALEGTSPLPVLEDLAADPNFTGKLVIGVAPEIFFSGFTFRDTVLTYFHKERPSQRAGYFLSRLAIEPYFSFDDPDFALGAVVQRQDWPVRPGTQAPVRVRKLSNSDADRNTHMWRKVEEDSAYRELCRAVWTSFLDGPPPPFLDTPEKAQAVAAAQITATAKAVATLRRRGVRMVFLRLPSGGHYLDWENAHYPRNASWDRLLEETGVPGIHFEDYPRLQGFDLPEWSHLRATDAEALTRALAPLADDALAGAQPP